MSLLSRNSCAKAFGNNWSRGKSFRTRKPKGGGGGFNEPPCLFLKGLIIYNIRNIHNINYKVNEDLNSKTSKDAVIDIGLQVLNVSF